MSLVVFAESFSRYKVTDFGDTDLQANFYSRYTNGGLSNNFASINSNGRNGACISVGRGSGSFFKTLPHSSEWVTGFAYRIDGAGAGGVDEFYSIGNNNTLLFSLRQAIDGTLVMYAGPNVIAVTERALLKSRWYYIEVDVSFSGSTITTTAELRINGHVEASGSASTAVNISSLLSGNAKGNVHTFSALGAVGGGNSFDDVYIKNASGYYGDIRVVALFPNGDASPTDWTTHGSGTHYLDVNTHPVDLTKWVESNTVNQVDMWDWEDCPGFSGTIKAINIGLLARKNDEGTRSFKILTGSTLSDEFFVSDVTPEYYEWALETDPATGLAWTQVGFNATQWGPKLIS